MVCAVVEPDVEAVGGQAPGHGSPDAFAGPGDQGDGMLIHDANRFN